MADNELTRRQILAGAGAAAMASLAGCSLFSNPKYTLTSRPRAGTGLIELFEWEPQGDRFHVSEPKARSYVDGLVETLHAGETVETYEATPVPENGTAQSGFAPVYTEHDGRYYRVRVQAEPATIERWVVWLEPLSETPADPVRYTWDGFEPSLNLSETDKDIFSDAASAVEFSEIDDRDHDTLPATERGFVFFEPYDPEQSRFVPEPPVEHVVVEPDSEFSDEDIPVRVHAEEMAVETTRYRHTPDEVAQSREELLSHLGSEHVVAEFSSAQLSQAVDRILQQSSNSLGYEEEGPPSDEFETILSELGLDGVSLPDDREVASWHRYYRRDDRYYRADMRLSDISLL